jgi:hypothetical protein
VSPVAKLAGFLLLIVLAFAAAWLAGAHLGPVTTSHSQVRYTQVGSGSPGTGGTGGMNMGGSP